MAYKFLALAMLVSETLAFARFSAGAPFIGSNTAFNQSDRNANHSNTVSFKHRDLGTWNWTVRVSDIPAPNLPGESADAHRAYTTYSFSWPTNGTLSDAIQAEERQDPSRARNDSCVLLFSRLSPPDLNAKYDNASSSCTGYLGEECEKAIYGVLGDVNTDCTKLGPISDKFWHTCNATLLRHLGSGNGFYPAKFGNESTILPGEVWASATSDVYQAGNRTAFGEVAGNVHILGFTGKKPQLICNRASSNFPVLPDGTEDAFQFSPSPPNAASHPAISMAFVAALAGTVVASAFL